ncbi:MAG: hypothetical protein ACHP7H_00305 [Hyphomicrobiales bacterium]
MPGPNDTVDAVARAIVNQSADAVTGVVNAAAAHILEVALPVAVAGVHGAFAVVVDQFQELSLDEAIDQAVDAMDGRVSRLAGLALKRAKRLLIKVLGPHRERVVVASRDLLLKSRPGAVHPIAAYPMALLLSEQHVIDEGSEALDGVGGRKRQIREYRLEMLQASNKRWVRPVEWLSHGLGPLWLVILPLPIGPVPVAPIAAAVLFVWTVLISGDQLDSPGIFPDFWKGVIRRSKGA